MDSSELVGGSFGIQDKAQGTDAELLRLLVGLTSARNSHISTATGFPSQGTESNAFSPNYYPTCPSPRTA